MLVEIVVQDRLRNHAPDALRRHDDLHNHTARSRSGEYGGTGGDCRTGRMCDTRKGVKSRQLAGDLSRVSATVKTDPLATLAS